MEEDDSIDKLAREHCEMFISYIDNKAMAAALNLWHEHKDDIAKGIVQGEYNWRKYRDIILKEGLVDFSQDYQTNVARALRDKNKISDIAQNLMGGAYFFDND